MSYRFAKELGDAQGIIDSVTGTVADNPVVGFIYGTEGPFCPAGQYLSTSDFTCKAIPGSGILKQSTLQKNPCKPDDWVCLQGEKQGQTIAPDQPNQPVDNTIAVADQPVEQTTGGEQAGYTQTTGGGAAGATKAASGASGAATASGASAEDGPGGLDQAAPYIIAGGVGVLAITAWLWFRD